MSIAETFIIEADFTLQFGINREIFITKINIGNGNYILELTDRTRCIGKRSAHNLKVTDGMLTIILQSYKRITCFEEGLRFFEKAFALEKNIEFVFAIRVFNRKLDQAAIGELITKYNLKVDSHIDSVLDNAPEPMQIALKFPGRNAAVGRFVGHFLNADFLFEFIALGG